MVSKKSPKANLESKRTVSLLLGFVVALSLIYISFEWSTKKVTAYVSSDTDFIAEDILDIPITAEKIVPPPPPPPKQVIFKDINVKDNDEPIENPLDIPDAGIDEPVEIPIAVPKIIEEDPIVEFLPQEFMPKFKGDLFAYMSQHIKYPHLAAVNDIQGRVICQFIVNKDGSISDIEVVKPVDPLLDREAVRVIQAMPKWEPGVQHGKPVRVKFTLPVSFKLK